MRALLLILAVLLAGDGVPRQISPPNDGITWSPYRPVYVHFHHIPLRVNNTYGGTDEYV
jgi:hypothetical protein